MKKNVFNPYQFIENTLWVDVINRASYTKHPDNFRYVDLSSDGYTSRLISKAFPNSNFYFQTNHENDPPQTSNLFLPDVPEESIHYMYTGDRLSFSNPNEHNALYQFIHEKLVPGGYVTIPYEATAGWSEYKVILDVLKEIVPYHQDSIGPDWLDHIFFELTSLSLKKITTFKNKSFLDKLLYYLKSIPLEILRFILCKQEFHTFYPYEIHKRLNQFDPGFRFVGSLPVMSNYLNLGLDEPQQAFLGNKDDLLMQSQRKDLIWMPFQRMDIWQKLPVTSEMSKGHISDFYFGCTSVFKEFPHKVTQQYMTLNFKDSVYTKLRSLFNKDFMNLDELIDTTKDYVTNPKEIIHRMMLLVMGGQLRYLLKKPTLRHNTDVKNPGKLIFKHSENQDMFSDIRRFYDEIGIVIHPDTGLIIPFDQKTSMVMSAWTKVHESLVPAYCVEIYLNYEKDHSILTLQKEFKAILLFLKQHYLIKFLELDLLDHV